MIRELKKERDNLIIAKRIIEKEHRQLPEGKLYCVKHRNSYQYLIDEKYASKKDSMKRIINLNKREYYDKLLPRINRQITQLSKLIKLYEQDNINNVYDSLNYGRQELLNDVSYRTPSQIIKDFMSIVPDTSFGTYQFPIDTGIYTNIGEQVRSKSEKIIADTLQYYGIPYKYELPLTLENGNTHTTIHPDFTVLNKSTAKKYYIEHFGMMSEESYFYTAMNKLDLYEKNNILIGRDLLIFHETASTPLNTSTVVKYIEEYLLE